MYPRTPRFSAPTAATLVAVIAAGLFATSVLIARDIPTVSAVEGSPSGKRCREIANERLTGTCPPVIGPQREEPWLPTIELPSPDEELGQDCNSIAVTIGEIRFLPPCPTDDVPFEQPLLAFGGATEPALHVPAPAPDYSGDYDAVPIRLCFDRDKVPSFVVAVHPSHDRRIGSARAVVHCCESC